MSDTFSILILTQTNNVHVQRWLDGLRARGHRVKVLARESHTDPDVYGPPAWMQRIAPLRKVYQLLAFWYLLVVFRPQVLHQQWFQISHLAPFFPRRLPLIISAWGMDIVREWTPQERDAIQRYAQRAAAIVCLSRFLAAYTEQLLHRPVDLVYWGVELQRFAPRAPEPHTDFRIGFMKHLAPKYAPDIALAAFARIKARVPHATLHLYGAGPMHDTLVTEAQRLGVADAVCFHGKIPYDQVPAALAQFDVMVMPSRDPSETLGVAALEAQAMGIPVVASRIGGIPESVRDGVGGLLTPPDDADALASAVLRLAEDADYRAQLGRQGCAYIREHFDWEQCVQAMEAVYARVLES